MVGAPEDFSSCLPWQQASWGVGVGAEQSGPGGGGSPLLQDLPQTPPGTCLQRLPREPSWGPPVPGHRLPGCPCTQQHRSAQQQ